MFAEAESYKKGVEGYQKYWALICRFCPLFSRADPICRTKGRGVAKTDVEEITIQLDLGFICPPLSFP